MALVAFADVAMAKTPDEVESIARSTIVKISLQNSDSVGSGVIIDRVPTPNGNLYTLVTNRHVVCGSAGGNCTTLPIRERYRLNTIGSQSISVNSKAIKLLSGNLDLAIVQFRSVQKYSVVSLANIGSLKSSDVVYTAGFPSEKKGLSFGKGKVLAAGDKRLIGDAGGYNIIYDAKTLPGMSGGGVFNGNGQLVAIHGYGDRYKSGTDINDFRVNVKTGYNRGIPIHWLLQGLNKLGLKLSEYRSPPNTPTAISAKPATADEYYIIGFNKYLDPGNNILVGKRQAIQFFDTAIKLQPKYANAYFMRGFIYTQLQEWQKGVDDFNKALILDENLIEVYYNRGIPRYELNDLRGALSDYNQAINISPDFADAYHNRARVRQDMKDFQGALSDLDKTIALNPEMIEAYFNRGNLKLLLQENSGAMADYNQAIYLNPKDDRFYVNRSSLKYKTNDTIGAIDDLNRAIILNPKNFLAYYNRGQIKKQLKDFRGALSDFSQVITLNPQDADAYYNRASIKQELRDFQGAVSDFTQVITLTPQAGDAYYHRGWIKVYKLNDRNGGIQDLQQAARLFRDQGQNKDLQLTIEVLRSLQATE
jgi:tetratricopeptide (TPR) repeat protein